jgi:hypothetical protein
MFSIKKYVLEIWMRYLNILGVAFHTSEEAIVNESNIKWARYTFINIFFENSLKKIYYQFTNRDKEYFEAHKLKEEHEENMKEDEDEIKIESYDLNEQETQQNISGYDDQEDSDNDENDNENEEENIEIMHKLMDESFNEKLDLNDDDDDYNEEEDISKKKKSRHRIVLTSFEYVRLPYTILILNLALLLMKSSILISDLVRYDSTECVCVDW